MRPNCPISALFAIGICFANPVAALEIRIDYTYDSNNFFNTQAKRDAIQAVADFYGDMIQDTLLRIDPADFSQATWTANFTHPATGSTQGIPGLVVPENVIIVYVGARELGGSVAGSAGPGGFSAGGFSSWFERIRGRGNPAAAAQPASSRTDYALWGGSISFDTPRNWNFSLTGNGEGSEFVTVALHEMGHVLGIGSADTWDNQLSLGKFTGPAATLSHGSAPSADGGHFTGSLKSPLFGSFSVNHGTSRPVLMLPSTTDNETNFDVATDLDLSALVDIGWELAPPLAFAATPLSPNAVSFSWQSVSFKKYALQRGTNLASFPDGGGVMAGNGLKLTWTDPSPPADKAFYRLQTSEAAALAAQPPMAAQALLIPAPDTEYRTVTEDPRVIENCHAAH